MMGEGDGDGKGGGKEKKEGKRRGYNAESFKESVARSTTIQLSRELC